MGNDILKFAKGEVIFRENEIQFYFYEILSGSVYVYSDYGMSSETLLTEMKPGQTFGEMGLLDYRRRSATVVAASDVEVKKIDDAGFDAYIAEDPQRLLRLMKQLSDRTRELTSDYNEALRTVSEIRAQKKESGLLARIARFARVWSDSRSRA